MNIENCLGLIYNACFITCFWPQMFKAVKTKSVEDVSVMLLFLSITGYAAALGYVLLKFGFDKWICINYILSSISVILMIIIYYRYKK